MPALISPLESDLTTAQAGGKGANLARLIRAGFPVPRGFVVLTAGYLAFVQAAGLTDRIPRRVEQLDPGDLAALEQASAEVGSWFRSASMPPALDAAIRNAYSKMGADPVYVAVRSSATAEDMPEMSFAGQQDTYLNVVGGDALMKAVVDCWASLWTARAIGYRLRNELPQSEMALAVVVQEMVQSEVSGVMFTANPVSGRRSELVINAAFGLGEALVSGLVEPDHYLVRKSGDGRIVVESKSLGSKAVVIQSSSGGGVAQTTTTEHAARQALDDGRIAVLAETGWRVSQELGSPQDIEWAWVHGQLFLLQSRPITSLYPLPEAVPAEPLHIWFSFGAVQGVLDPITPLGRDLISLIGVGVARYLGLRPSLEDQTVFYVAGERLFLNITPLLNNRIGREILPRILGAIEPGTVPDLLALRDEAGLAPGRAILSLGTALHLARVAIPTPLRMLRTLLAPERARQGILDGVDDLLALFQSEGLPATTLGRQLDLVDHFIALVPKFMVERLIPSFAPGILMLAGLRRLAADLPSGERLALTVTRGLPFNVTTEMDLILWDTARAIRGDPAAAAYFSGHSAAQLADDYLIGRLPAVAQSALVHFMDRYGARGLSEIDLGRARWGEQPAPVMQTLLSYLAIDEQHAPDVVFQRGAVEAQRAVEELVESARGGHGGLIRAHQLQLAADRVRALAGLRELPKFFLVRILGILRAGLLRTGRSLVTAGLFQKADDIFFLHFRELRELSAHQRANGEWIIDSDSPLRSLTEGVVQRRGRDNREKLRRQVPRLLLSDGRALYGGVAAVASAVEGSLTGEPVSPGVVEGTVRVVLNPHEANLQPGEILVCHGTDPAWTPLFLAAGGLVMEVGGVLTHGSVVAREYGIPAVVGVERATERLKTGQLIRVDGSTGQILVL